MFLEKWFTTNIWYDYVSFDFNSVKEECELFALTHEGRKISNIGGWQSTDIYLDNLNEYKKFKSIQIVLNIINQKIEEFAKEINLDPQQKLELDNVWINLNGTGHYNDQHAHENCFFAGVLYVNVNVNTGDIVFVNNNINPHFEFSSTKAYPVHHNVSYKPENGKIIIFPSWAQHKVLPNESDEVRISLSFNIQLKQLELTATNKS